ncbi:ubiquitin [Clostridium sp. LP20]|uniref:ubiquitin n=1 Tax=Clostridium sp. LP20 TaxID=3418665 RepID=UPI003EE6340A
MDNLKLVEKLKEKTNISYEEAKEAMEKSNWDILEAMLYLEEKGRIPRPSTRIFYTNEYKENNKHEDQINNKDKKNHYYNEKKGNIFGGIFEWVCKFIDTCNNILFEIRKEDIVFLSIPITVIGLLLIFTFWIVIPLAIVGLFFDIEFSLSSNKVDIGKVNNIFKLLSENIKKLKEELRKGIKNG